MAIALFSLVGVIPKGRVRKFINDVLFKAGFRLICRPLSAVVSFHNLEYRPKTQGFCVANHTSPLDVAILGQDCTYSLVRLNIQSLKKKLPHSVSICVEHFLLGYKLGRISPYFRKIIMYCVFMCCLGV